MRTPGRRQVRRYFGVLAAAVAFFLALPCALSLAFLWRSGELSSYSETVRRQQETGAMWESAINGGYHRYQLEVYRASKADVLALGSSRMLRFHQEYFDSSFSSAGLGMSDLAEGKVFLGQALAIHKPKVILLGLDFWWFNGDAAQGPGTDEADNAPSAITRSKLVAPYTWLWQGKVAPGEFGGTLLRGAPQDRLGVHAIVWNEGFLADGSSGPLEDGPSDLAPDRFDDGLARARAGADKFQAGTSLGDRLALLKEILATARQNDVQVVLFLGPMPPPVAEAMRASGADYAYVDKLKGALNAMPVEYYDFLTPSPLTSDPADYTDGVHWGQRLSGAMVLEMLNRNPNSALAPYVDRAWLEQDVARLTSAG